MDKKTIKRLLEAGTISPLVANSLFEELFGDKYFLFAPETLWLTLSHKYNTNPPRYNKDCIQAVVTVKKNPLFANDWLLFEKVCKGLNGYKVVFTDIQPLKAGEVIYALYAINNLVEDFKLSPDVSKYVMAVWQNDGTRFMPKMIKKYVRPFLIVDYPTADKNDPAFEYFLQKMFIERLQFSLKNKEKNND